MIHGFLGTRATIMFDVVTVALVLFLPTLAWSIGHVRRGRYKIHKRVQITLGVTLFLVVSLFEADIQVTRRVLDGGWRSLTTASPYHGALLDQFLRIHLIFATSTAILWIATLAHALAMFPRPPRPGGPSRWHKYLAWSATAGIFATAVTGWTFYYMAFVATI